MNGEIYNHKKLKARGRAADGQPAHVLTRRRPPPQVLIDAQTPSDSDSEVVGFLYKARVWWRHAARAPAC